MRGKIKKKKTENSAIKLKMLLKRKDTFDKIPTLKKGCLEE